jgi:hypothetical protein
MGTAYLFLQLIVALLRITSFFTFIYVPARCFAPRVTLYCNVCEIFKVPPFSDRGMREFLNLHGTAEPHKTFYNLFWSPELGSVSKLFERVDKKSFCMTLCSVSSFILEI